MTNITFPCDALKDYDENEARVYTSAFGAAHAMLTLDVTRTSRDESIARAAHRVAQQAVESFRCGDVS